MKYRYNLITIGLDPTQEGIASEFLKLLEDGGEIISAISMLNGSRYIIKTPIKTTKKEE